jgi:hypothetical protein
MLVGSHRDAGLRFIVEVGNRRHEMRVNNAQSIKARLGIIRHKREHRFIRSSTD